MSVNSRRRVSHYANVFCSELLLPIERKCCNELAKFQSNVCQNTMSSIFLGRSHAMKKIPKRRENSEFEEGGSKNPTNCRKWIQPVTWIRTTHSTASKFCTKIRVQRNTCQWLANTRYQVDFWTCLYGTQTYFAFTNTMPFHRWPIRTDFYEGNEHHIETDIAKSIKMIFKSESASLIFPYCVVADGRKN